MKTIKLPYKCNADKNTLSNLMNQQNNIVHIASHWKCKKTSIEDLNIKTNNKRNG